MSRSSHSYEDNNTNQSNKKDCKACFDFKDWLKSKSHDKQKNSKVSPDENLSREKNENNIKESLKKSDLDNRRANCPLYRDELGRNTWSFLHTMAAYYPEKPSINQEKEMENFINGFATFFPCDECASDFQEEIKKNPPRTKNHYDLSQWFCEQHNIVNRKLSKPEFDCSKVFERWKDGWKDGSCD